MQLFIDSASSADIHAAFSSGLACGLTTNPALIAKEPPHQLGYLGHLRSLLRATPQLAEVPFSVQPPITDLTESPRETVGKIKGHLQARRLVIKIPVSPDTMPIIHTVSTIAPVNATCIFTPEQALAAINAGASYISFFYRRMVDAASATSGSVVGGSLGGSAEGSVRLVRDLIDRTGARVQIICGSIREPQDVSRCFAAGAHIVTAPLKILMALTENENSLKSAAEFESRRADWEASCEALPPEIPEVSPTDPLPV